MPKPLDRTFVTGRLAALVRPAEPGKPERVVLDEREHDGGLISIEVAVEELVALFGDVDVEGQPAAVRDRLKQADHAPPDPAAPDGDPARDGFDRGYASYADHWHAQGLLGPNPPRSVALPSGRIETVGETRSRPPEDNG